MMNDSLHTVLISSLSILRSSHCKYGAMVGIQFIPWICSGDECAQLSHLFETDFRGEAFRLICQVCGGETVDERILGVALHAFEKGYMDNIN